MKKGVYRATDVKKINLEKLNQEVAGKDIVLGVDVAKEDFMAAILDKNRNVIKTIKWKHPFESHLLLDLILKDLRWHSLEVAMEPSGTYGDSLRFQFLGNGISVFRVSPKRVHDAAEVFDGVPSMHDAKASAIIGRLHLDGLSEEWPMPEDSQRELTAVVRTMEMYDDAYYRNVNRLEGLTARYWPELTKYLKLQSATLLELLKEFGSPEFVAQSSQEAGELMKKIGGAALKEEKIKAVLESAPNSLGVKCIEAEREQVQELCQEIRRLQKLRRQARYRVEALTQNIDCLKEMTPVIGKVTSAVLYLTLGNVEGYDNAGSVAKALGLNLKERSSGYKKGQLRITKRGSGFARMYLYMAVLRLVKSNTIIKAWYHKKIIRDGGLKMKALVAIMRKLAGALWHVGKGAKFDASLLFDTSRLAI
jgi:transposase